MEGATEDKNKIWWLVCAVTRTATMQLIRLEKKVALSALRYSSANVLKVPIRWGPSLHLELGNAQVANKGRTNTASK